MLRLKLDINGHKIGTIGVHNKQDYNDDGEVRYGVYDLRGNPDELSDEIKICDVWHHGAYGAASLTAAVMDEVPESRLDQPPK